MSYDLLQIITNVLLGNNPTGPAAAFPQRNGPDPTVVHLQSILYSSLVASLLATFIAMLGKQWLSRCSQVEMHGSIIDRSCHRQRKMNGMITRHCDLVMECLPLMLQAALLLLGYALSNHLFFVNKVVASVLIGFASFGLLFTSSSPPPPPFLRLPVLNVPSLTLRFLIRFDNDHRKYLERSGKRLKRLFSQKKKKRSRPKSVGGPWSLPGVGTFDGGNSVDHVELPMTNTSELPTPPSIRKPAGTASRWTRTASLGCFK